MDITLDYVANAVGGGRKVRDFTVRHERAASYIIAVAEYPEHGDGTLCYVVLKGPHIPDCERYGEYVSPIEFHKVPCMTKADERRYPKRCAKIGSEMLQRCTDEQPND